MTLNHHIEKEVSLLREGMHSYLERWSSMENGLSMLLQQVLTFPSKYDHKPYGFAVYFAATSAETRLAIIDAVLEQFFRRDPNERIALDAWAIILKQVSLARRFRNKIAHGTVHVTTIYDKQHARITGPLFDLKKHPPGRPIQAHGISLSELNSQLSKIGARSSHVGALSLLVSWRQLFDEATLREKYLELLTALKTAPDESISLNYPEWFDPLQSSDA